MEEKRLFQNESPVVCEVLFCETFPSIKCAHMRVYVYMQVYQTAIKATAFKNGPYIQP